MQRRPAPANKSLHPVRVPSLEDVIATAAKPPNPLRPVDSPTLGATAAFSGLNAALQSPCVADSSSDANGVVPSRLMPPPPSRQSSLSTTTPGGPRGGGIVTTTSSASNATTTSSSASNATTTSSASNESGAKAQQSEVDVAGQPLDRRGSLSPGKRRRAPEDDAAAVQPGADLPATSSGSGEEGEGQRTGAGAAPSAAAAAGAVLASGAASISSFLGLNGATNEASSAAAAAETDSDGFAGAADDDAGEDRPASPTKRQARAPAFGQAHMLSGVRAAARAAAAAPAPQTTVVDMYSPGMLRIPVFRIPALLTLPNGVCLAFAEARPSLHDAGVIDMVMRRSTDHGLHWSPARVIVEGGMLGAARSATVGNPCAVFDNETQTVWLLLCTNHADDVEWQIHARQGRDSVGRRIWITSSSDLGKSWARPKEITADVKQPSWTWYATGPGMGVQLPSGRLLVPCNHAEDVAEHQCPYLPHQKRSRMVAHCIYSDDHGKTWRLGGNAAKHTNETTLARLPDGQIIMNSRDWSGRFLRVIQTSNDDGKSWRAPRYDKTLIEPEPQGCHGSMIAVPPSAAASKGCLFFCNPSSDRREMLTIRRSDDGGASWTKSFVLEDGPSAYSSLGLTHDGCLGVLYERGGQISFARIPSHPDGPLGDFC